MESKTQFPATEAVFATASKRFYNELSDEDKQEFYRIDNPSDMIASIEQHIADLNSSHTAKLRAACQKIDQFGLAMNPFFKIVDILVSSHPDWAAIAWGAIRMVFQLSSHFTGFFEKLANMFEEFRRMLPNYQTHVEIIRGRISEVSWRQTHECLFKALSLIYVDMLQFCHDACRLFSKKRRGVRYKAAVIWDLFWTPFDQRFADILVRIKRHREEFESGLTTVYSEEMMRHFNAMDEERLTNAQQREVLLSTRVAAEKEAMNMKIESLQRWIAAPNWTGPFCAAKTKRVTNSGLWILERAEYKSWLAQEVPYPSHGSIFAKNILVISAKPGYGKTILSTRVIEDIQQRLRNKALSSHASETSCMAYFYFDQQQADRYSRVTALQVVAAQLLFAQRHNRTFIDIASLLMLDEGDGQMCASEQSLETLIRIYVQKLEESYLVFDGLDECADWSEFLISLRRCTEQTSCKVVLTTRPHLSIGSIIGQKPFHMELNIGENLEEITAILRPEITSLISLGKLGPRFNLEGAEDLIARLAIRADSIVLWAVILTKYLQSKTLTPTDREEIINEDMPFNGLDELYLKILQDLGRRVPYPQHQKAQKVFEWLVITHQPWTTTMLEQALAVNPSRPSSQTDFLEDFDQSLMDLCGPLVEIRQDRVVRFIHLSVAEYLVRSEHLTTESAFFVSISKAHSATANLCLTYLKNEIPQKPLAGNASTRPHQLSIALKYSLLQYAVTYWAQHATECLQHEMDRADNLELITQPTEAFTQKHFLDLFQLLSKLTTDKLLVTVWIEASWTFEVPPSLMDIPDRIVRSIEMVPERSQKLKTYLQSLGQTLQRLSGNLSHLNKGWGLTLAELPNEIWLPSTNSFTDSEFWVGTDAAEVKWLPSSEEEQSVLIVSQVSMDGKAVGVIKVWPSKPLKQPHRNCFAGSFDHLAPSDGSTSPQPNWLVAYQVWSLETLKMQTAIRLEIAAENILDGDATPSVKGPQMQGFRFPVALSSSLGLAFIMGVVVQTPDLVTTPSHDGWLQCQLLDPRCPYGDHDERLLQKLHEPFYPLVLETEDTHAKPTHIGDQPRHKWLRCFFSPCETYLISLKGEGAPGASRLFSSWVLEIYRKANQSPKFLLTAISGVRLNGRAVHAMLFHPTRPLLALCLMSTTAIWRFTLKESSFITIYNYPLDHMRFSNCGNFLQGVKLGYPGHGEPVFLHVESWLSIVPLAIAEASRSDTTLAHATPGSLSSQVVRSGNFMMTNSARQGPGVPVFTNSQGQLQVSVLSQDTENRAVMLRTIRADGKMIEETITRLPQFSSLEQSYSTLVPTKNHHNLRLVLNMAAQDTYSPDTKPDLRLPAILDRKKESVPMTIYTPQHRLGSSINKRFLDGSLILNDNILEENNRKKQRRVP